MIDSYGNNVFFMNKFPVKACCTRNEDGSHSIFINAMLSHEGRIRAYNHELKHILNNDFDKDNIQEIEHDAHRRECI